MKAKDLERILDDLTSDKNGHIRGKGRAMDKIQSLHLTEIQSEYYEKTFVDWYSGMERAKIERAYLRWKKEK